MSAPATETVTSRASELFRFARDQHQQAPMIEDDAARATVQAVFEMAEAAMDRAKEVHTEHDRRIESVEYALYLQAEHIRELQATIEDLITGGVATASKQSQQVRVRRNYSPATKDRGWNCEHTLEAVYPMDAIDWEEVGRQDEKAHEVFESECARRDKSEGRDRRFFS